MKKLTYFSLFFLSVLILLLGALLVSPYYFYKEALEGRSLGDFYVQNRDIKELLKPKLYDEIKLNDQKLSNLWQEFHMGDLVIPLPVKDPLYEVIPILELDNNQSNMFGVSFLGTDKRELFKVMFVKNKQNQNRLNGQKLFTLPIIQKGLLSYSEEEQWRDLFEKEYSDWNVSFSEMIRGLYILDYRAHFFPLQMLSFGKIKGAPYSLIEVASSDLDYICEYIFTRHMGAVYSAILYTRKDSTEAKDVRDKILSGLKFRPDSPSLSKIIYNEFMALSYHERIDQKGMLYLFSALSHDPEVNYVKEMIEFLERGERNDFKLKALYKYAYQKYGRTFSSKRLDSLTGELQLKQNIEVEEKHEEMRLRDEEQNKPIHIPKPTKEELRLKELNKAKNLKPKSSSNIIFD